MDQALKAREQMRFFAAGPAALQIACEVGNGIDKGPVASVLKRAQLEIEEQFNAPFEPTQIGAVLLIWSTNRLGRGQ